MEIANGGQQSLRVRCVAVIREASGARSQAGRAEKKHPGTVLPSRGFSNAKDRRYGPTLRSTLMVVVPVTSTSSKGDVVALIAAVTVFV